MERATFAAALAVLSSLMLSGCLGTDFCLGLGYSNCPMYVSPPPWMNTACTNAGGHWTSSGPEFVSCCRGPPYCADENGSRIDLSQFQPTPTPVTTATPATTPGFCGGIAGIPCPAGFTCRLDGNYPDAGGVCVPSGQASPTATPAVTPIPSSANPCEQNVRNQLFVRYHPTWCTGMPPCTPLGDEEVKAKITVDLRQSPTLGFTYQQGNMCGIVTYVGRGWITPETCAVHDLTITNEYTELVPC